MYDASDRKHVRRAQKEAEIADKLRGDWLRGAMGTVAGRAWFHDLIASCEVFHETASFDTNASFYSRGRRNVGLQIFGDVMRHCPDLYLLMMQEQNAKAQANERSNDKPSADHTGNDDDTGGTDDDSAASPEHNRGP